jgi:hypothetical protein
VIEIAFSDAEVAELQALQRHPHHVVRRKALVLILKSQKIAHCKIAQIADVCENTVRQCFETYQQGGIEKLKRLNKRNFTMSNYSRGSKKPKQENAPYTLSMQRTLCWAH